MFEILQIIFGSTCQVLKMTILMMVADALCGIIHESDFKSVACLYLMAASASQ